MSPVKLSEMNKTENKTLNKILNDEKYIKNEVLMKYFGYQFPSFFGKRFP